jgi:multidrug efflux pump subunit AcrA (membrane-fusion protein)
VTGGREAYTARKQAVKIQLRKPACCDAEAVDKAEGNIRSSDIARSRRDRRSPLSRGMLPKGFSRNPGELAIALRERPAAEGDWRRMGQIKDQSYDPIVPVKVGNRRAFAKSGHGTHWREGEKKRTDLPKET